MLFSTQQYFIFFAGIFALYWVLPWQRPRVWLLVAASIYFYACWNHWLAALICVSTTADYVLARCMGASSTARTRKLLLGASLAGNLGLLCYFKYANFFLQSLEEALHAAGIGANLPLLRVILPIGISFYTFEAINYMVDVYRRRIPAERNLLNLMLFILFFPHLVAGPIVRARDFLRQTVRPKRWDWMRLQLGVQYFVMGMIKKLAIADRMAYWADPVFADPGQFRAGALWVGVLAYAIQVYADFSGYSDMAIGSAHLLGYKLNRNFNLPYLAANISDMWRRWHISLSTWLRDYVFFPLVRLGPGRKSSSFGRLHTYAAVLVTMTACGLWHGAAWTFVCWGVVHGLLMVAHQVFEESCDRRSLLARSLQTPLGTAGRVATTFLVWCLTLVLFRCTTLAAAGTCLERMLTWHPAGQGTGMPDGPVFVTLAFVIVCHVLAAKGLWKRYAVRLPSPALGFGYATAAALALLLSPDATKAFIYFQF